MAAIASAIYFFINRSRRKKLAADIDGDARFAGSFSGATRDFPLPPEQSRWSYGWLWVGIIATFIGLAILIAGSAWGALMIAGGLGLAVYDFYYGLSRSEPEDCLVHAEFHANRIDFTHRFSGKTEHFFGSDLAITVECREITEKSFGADALKGYGIYLRLQVPAPADGEILLDFPGVAEFLGRCRHLGSPVGFSADGPTWFKAKLEALPSWQPGYFDQLPNSSAQYFDSPKPRRSQRG